MRLSPWIDHIPPWLAFGAVSSTGVYEPGELASMALPLLCAALAQSRTWELGSWRRTFETAALACLLGLLWARIGLVPTTVIMLFLLCGIRLALPRELSQRRQILLMGFLIWITTAITTFEVGFLAWSVLWVAGAGAVMMQQAWEGSARLRGGPLQRAPYSRLPGWTLGTVLVSSIFFVTLPRITLGLRAFPWSVAGLTTTQAGFSDTLDLGAGGPISSNNEVVLRVLPPVAASAPALAESLALLRGITLEALEGQRWDTHPTTPSLAYSSADLLGGATALKVELEYFVAPSPQGLLPLPYGRITVLRLPGMPLFGGPGGSLRWMYPTRRPVALRFSLERVQAPLEPPPRGRRWALLTATGRGTESADRFSRRIVPEEVSAVALAQRLSDALQRFDYSLENPSGSAANPLQDFLEVSQAGHCEYFASSLALMLRYRGIPARVVNGYRLGPWIAEGGYWLVTQNEAHSWVEFYDAQAGGWRVADPTPAAHPTGLEASTFWAAFQRWTDAVRFRWDRHVVRFSDEDQMAGLQWFQARISNLPDWRPSRSFLISGSMLGIAVAILWKLRRSAVWRRWLDQPRCSDHGLKPLGPLLRVAGRPLQPTAGETARQWLLRLADRLPQRSETLARVAEEADAVAYGGLAPGRLRALVKAEAKVLRRLLR